MIEEEVKQNSEEVYKTGKDLYNLFKKATAEVQPFAFTGQITDLEFLRNGVITPSMINSISDPVVKNAVIEMLKTAEKDGLINVDLESGKVSLSDEGKKYIEKPDFINEMQNEQTKAAQKGFRDDSLGVEFDGTDKDLNFFRHSNELNLKEIAQSSDIKTAEKIFINAEQWEKGGLVTRSSNDTLKLTEKGEKLLNSPAFEKTSNNAVEKAIGTLGAPGKIAVVTKKVLTTVAQTQTAINTLKKQSTTKALL
jgi:predicted transcriptional regulator